MNKTEFLNELKFHLQKMDVAEKDKFISYYDEIISDYMENGLSEKEAVNKIGASKDIAKELLEHYDSVKITLPSTGSKILNITLAIISFPLWGSVLLTVLLLVFSAYIVIWCAPVVTGASCVGFLTSSIVGIIGTPFVLAKSFSIGMIQLGTAISSIGISILLGLLTIYLSKKLIIITKKFTSKLATLFKKKVVIR